MKLRNFIDAMIALEMKVGGDVAICSWDREFHEYYEGMGEPFEYVDDAEFRAEDGSAAKLPFIRIG